MSWSGFKKNVGRATTQVMMKTGHVEKTNDREYEVEERRYRTLESASLRLQKEAKGYLDSLRAMTASQMRIAETIDAFYGDSGARDGVSRSYKQAVEDLDAETVKALDGPYRYISPKDCYVDLDGFDPDLKHEIEQELNFKSKDRVITEHFVSNKHLLDMALMMSCYRTTVLEPINRFCAYFPDINECIKKRNHKMLDYDAMRAKVKKLVEKPDKDPTKLPRAEKETEMVGDPLLAQTPSKKGAPDLFMATSGNVATVLEQHRQQQQAEDEELISRLYGMGDGVSINSRTRSRVSSMRRASAVTDQLDDSASMSSNASSFSTGMGPYSPLLANLRTGPELLFNRSSSESIRTAIHDVQRPPSTASTVARKSAQDDEADGSGMETPKAPLWIDGKLHPAYREGFSKDFRNYTPFFGPSDLEEALRPHALHYIELQTDKFDKAKQQYEQLNEQLTNELPQLIDLRVPYLDPSFEALVKIQLRFCAEAYSRMAQVQQYLDASTRDQYASGDLDARVEDVLGQIRELSIAGTV